jgi:GT2 family glycosyltransferase
MLPSVSIVVLNYNGRKHLDACLGSLLKLNYPRQQFDVILVDNGSVDGSVSYVAGQFPTVQLVKLTKNVGFARGNNIGAQAAKGDYVAFVNNDMRVDSEWLIKLVQAIQAEDATCVGSRILTWDGNEPDFVGGTANFYGMGFQPESGGSEDQDSMRDVLFVCGGAMLVRRDVFLEAGGFDEDYFAYFEDVDLGWRLWVLGHRVLFVPGATAYHRGHATGEKFAAERRALLYERNALFTILKNYGDETLSRVLPVALLLTARRSVMMSGEDKREFRMEAEASPSAIWPRSPGARGLAEGHLRRGLGTLMRQHGLWAVAKEAMRRALRWVYARSIRQIKRDVAVVPRVALSPVMALDDVAERLPQIWARRQEIQTRRARSDAEILPLFIDPFHPHPPEDSYLDLQQRLVDLFRIGDLFSEPDSRGSLST